MNGSKCENGFKKVEMFWLCMFWRHALGFPLTFLTDCKIDVNNNNPAGLEHCKLMASVVQYLMNEGKTLVCENVTQYIYTLFVIIIIHIHLIGLILMYFVSCPCCVLCLMGGTAYLIKRNAASHKLNIAKVTFSPPTLLNALIMKTVN